MSTQKYDVTKNGIKIADVEVTDDVAVAIHFWDAKAKDGQGGYMQSFVWIKDDDRDHLAVGGKLEHAMTPEQVKALIIFLGGVAVENGNCEHDMPFGNCCQIPHLEKSSNEKEAG